MAAIQHAVAAVAVVKVAVRAVKVVVQADVRVILYGGKGFITVILVVYKKKG
ncbi:hypothetical protein CLROS_013160 [Clostridium felsineum]|uniref:Uncharacterized protein n=1 Tax=Clostridium felsineum TaxID=36839 RepID=A0A1S8L0U9_9CLOT|nr:hypothetical protein CLROS_013160 [Clostridium felsineum]URZ11021.1 hypothetical protein CROST_017370 [Clostridium felsineum]